MVHFNTSTSTTHFTFALEIWARECIVANRCYSAVSFSFKKMALFSDPETQRTIDKELEIVKKTLNEKVEGSELISCHPLAVNVRITLVTIFFSLLKEFYYSCHFLILCNILLIFHEGGLNSKVSSCCFSFLRNILQMRLLWN